jgi:CRP-like cAMP-binding protein
MSEERVRPSALPVSEKSAPAERVAARLAPLPGSERDVLDHLLARRRTFQPRRDIAREGEPPRAIYVLLEGWACRYKTLPDGRRQIVGLLVPGDVCDLDIGLAATRDHSLATIQALTAAEIAPAELEAAMDAHPGLSRGIRRIALTVASIQREWTLNVGQRSAYERIAHLCCEMFFRLDAVGLVQGASCEFPITQTDLAEATGLTPVHVNRTLQALRSDGLVDLRGRRLTLPDLPRLTEAALFSPDYLHLPTQPRHMAADA